MAKGDRRRADEALLTALACGATVEAAAQSAGLSARTAFRRQSDLGFQRRLEVLRDELVQRPAAMLTAASMDSVKTLVELQRPSFPASIRLGAARAILDLAIRYRENAEFAKRLTAVEQGVRSGYP